MFSRRTFQPMHRSQTMPDCSHHGAAIAQRHSRRSAAPQARAQRSTTYRSVHEGKHLDKYSENLSIKLSEIREKGKLSNYTREQYIEEIDNLVIRTYQDLKYGKIQLNKNTRESLGLPLKGDQK